MAKNCISIYNEFSTIYNEFSTIYNEFSTIYNEFSNIGPTRSTWTLGIKVLKGICTLFTCNDN